MKTLVSILPSVVVLGLVSFGGTQPVFAQGKDARTIRVAHAKELMGSTYRHSIVRKSENLQVNQMIYEMTHELLPKKFKSQSKRVARAILAESSRYKFDPVFLMAIIQGESSFNPDMLGHFGEIGLMQVKPDTAEWIGHKAHIRWSGAKTLHDPVANIRYGAAYMSWLREKFDSHAQLYIAAYNMGQRHVNRAIANDVWPKDYPLHVMTRYVELYNDLNNRSHHNCGPNKKSNECVDRKIASI